METALTYALTYSSAVNGSKLDSLIITILADQDYYSKSESSADPITQREGRFVDFDISLSQAHKTGLGSSAALVSALTTAVVAHYTRDNGTKYQLIHAKSILHNLAQAAHCAAQGKIGSGFDVAAAIYGSCTYRRFSPSILEGLGDVGSCEFATRLRAVVDDTDTAHRWDTQIDKSSSAAMPQGLQLLMCDVDCGSETVGMVRKVLEWKKEKPEEATHLWNQLQEINEQFAQELQRLSLKPAASDLTFSKLRQVMSSIRSYIREMSTRSKVPIEPQVQTDLIDACCRIEGVVAGVVPGAGGFDAIALLVHDDQEVIDALSRFIEGYRTGDSNAEVRIDKVRLLGVRQDDEGLKAENVALYQQWLR